jgi:hypothetical protein
MLEVSINTKNNNPNINYEKVGNTNDGRVIYETTNLKTNQKSKFTVPQQNVDKFDKVINEMAKFSLNKYDNPTKMVQKVYLGNVFGAVAGAGLSAFLTKNSSTTKRVLGVIGGSIGGLVVGAMTSLFVILSDITSKVVKFGKFSKDLDVKPYSETSNQKIEEKSTQEPEKKLEQKAG